MKISKIFSGRALFVEKNVIWVARGLSFWGIDKFGNRITQKYIVGSLIDRIFASFRLTRQLLREGIHHLIPLHNGGFLITIKKTTLILDKRGHVLNLFTGYSGNKPAHRGVCAIPDGTIFFGEYTVNIHNNKQTSLYRSTDNGMSFQRILTFKKDEIRHIHFIQWDEFEECIWMGTGDKDYECKLMRSVDKGDSWEVVGQGSQLWRAVGISVTKDALYWGTDAGSVSNPNYIIRMDRKTRSIEKLIEIQGPCHGNAVLLNEIVLVSTGVEGGENEKDSCAHVWSYTKWNNAQEKIKMEKDFFPYIIQYGVIRFPMGLNSSDTMIFTAYALKRYGETVCIGKEKLYE